MDVPCVRTHRRTRPTRACPLAVSRYRAAFLVRIPFISILPSAHGSKWLPGRTRRARTSRRCVVSSCVIEIPCDERTKVGATARPRRRGSTRGDARRRSLLRSPPPPLPPLPLTRSLARSPRQPRIDVKAYARVHVSRFALHRPLLNPSIVDKWTSPRRIMWPLLKNQFHSLSSFPTCMACYGWDALPVIFPLRNLSKAVKNKRVRARETWDLGEDRRLPIFSLSLCFSHSLPRSDYFSRRARYYQRNRS